MYYGIFLSLFTCALGVAFIAVAVVILSQGNWQQGAYSRELVAKMLFPVSIPFYIWIAAIATGYALSVIYPQAVKKTPAKVKERVQIKRLSSRLPQGSGEAYDADMRKIYVEKRSRIIVYSVCGAVCFAGGIASAVYLFNPANFPQGGVANDLMLKMFINVGPWVIVSICGCIGVTLYEKYSMLREITVLKHVISSNRGNPVINSERAVNPVLEKIKKVASSAYFLWAVRGVIAVLAVTFIILGIFNEGMRDVLIKAIAICTECIGLG